ncbi:MAG: RNA 2',3'-cyclic phosphodiesterase [Archaeoglobaceae archaeon]|nr:RNA 2',3'-cyclic phosphodiesterase [Archaeoglobaceae archaeon]MDW8118319.1 RNA 2',3'-cyclic phosphodiesterase [Archaeoglobaceae archaeon]
MRLFVAVDMDEKIKENLLPLLEKLSKFKGLKTVERENLHATLMFLGEVPDAKLTEIQTALSKIEFKNFRISLNGVEKFPKKGDPRVVWVAIEEGRDKMIQLAESVYFALKKLGFERDKAFEAHVTVARIKRKIPELDNTLGEFRNVNFGEMDVKDFRLKQSTLKPSGPVYKDVYVFGGRNE